MAKHKLTIEIDETGKAVTIRHEEEGKEPREYFLQSLAIFGGDAVSKELFAQLYGASADAAWAYAQTFVVAQAPNGGAGMRNFFKQCAAHICMAIDPFTFQNEIAAEEALNKWECKDQSKWAGWDSEDVLADKAASEAARAEAERQQKLIEGLASKENEANRQRLDEEYKQRMAEGLKAAAMADIPSDPKKWQ